MSSGSRTFTAGREGRPAAATRVMIVDDYELIRTGLRDAIERNAQDLEVDVTCSSVDEAMTRIDSEGLPDIVLLDLMMPGMEYLAGIERMRKAGVPRIVILTGVVSAEAVALCQQKGADGYLQKTMSGVSLVAAIRLILSGASYFPSDIAAKGEDSRWLEAMVDDFMSAASGGYDGDRGLTRREASVMNLVVDGLSNKEIARNLDVCEATVKAHVRQIFRKFGVSRRSQLVRQVIEST